MMMMITRALSAVLSAALIASPASASPLGFGASLSVVQREYAGAQLIKTSPLRRTLRLKNLDYAGLRWENADFTFDSLQRLSEVTLRTKSISYDALLAMASRVPTASGYRMSHNLEPADTGVELRVCEQDDGYVTLTYEPRRIPA